MYKSETIKFDKAFFIKMGRKGAWEESAIKQGKIRIGWREIKLGDIQQERWDKIKKEIRTLSKTDGSASADFNALRNIYDADSNTVFITFYGGKLYWCKSKTTVKRVLEDDISKYRPVDGQWQCRDMKGEILDLSKVPGKISKVQRFSGTCCQVHEFDILFRLINGLHSEEYKAIEKARKQLTNEVKRGITLLHPKEFELLVELIFRQSGWRRVSVLGESLKDIDLELEDPITLDRYMVQIKSESNVKEFKEYAVRYNEQYKDKFRYFYYVVHTTKEKLRSDDERIKIVLPDELAKMVISSGLVDWLLNKIR